MIMLGCVIVRDIVLRNSYFRGFVVMRGVVYVPPVSDLGQCDLYRSGVVV